MCRIRVVLAPPRLRRGLSGAALAWEGGAAESCFVADVGVRFPCSVRQVHAKLAHCARDVDLSVLVWNSRHPARVRFFNFLPRLAYDLIWVHHYLSFLNLWLFGIFNLFFVRLVVLFWARLLLRFDQFRFIFVCLIWTHARSYGLNLFGSRFLRWFRHNCLINAKFASSGNIFNFKSDFGYSYFLADCI